VLAAPTLLACMVATNGSTTPTTSSSGASANSTDTGADANPGNVVGGCQVFPKNNYWNTPVDHLEVDPHSDAWMSHMSPDSKLHPDFGKSYGEQPVPYGIPITIVDDGHPRVPVTFQYRSQSDPGPYPLGDDTLIEGGRHSSGDRHALIVDSDSCELFETWHTRQKADGWHAGSGAIWSLHSNKLRKDGWTSADAAGMSILAGLLRYDEVEVDGVVTHAIRFTTDETQTAHIWPARHDAGSQSSEAYPPMGARFRLKADFPTSGYRADTVVILRAMKTYGLVLADNGSPWYFQGTADKRWPNALLDELKSIPADAFEAVDTAPMEIHRGSGRARQ
jgi:hypothetical protein